MIFRRRGIVQISDQLVCGAYLLFGGLQQKQHPAKIFSSGHPSGVHTPGDQR